ncbi:MAG: 2'-5' RNA ligase family protein [Georgenia sp.]
MRLFASLELPGAVQDHLDLAVAALRGTPAAGPPALRWVPVEQRHITLAFFGEVPDGAVPELGARLGAVAEGCAPLRLRLRGAGVFGHRTLWVGVQEDGGRAGGGSWEGDGPWAGEPVGASPDRLVGLMAACDDAGAPLRRGGFERAPRDRRRAHVTIARLGARRGTPEDLPGRAHALSVYEGPAWDAADVTLVLSRPGEGRGGGPLYEPVERFPLAAAPR